MGAESQPNFELRQFPRSPALLREAKPLIEEARKLIEERYAELYFGSAIASGDVREPSNLKAERDIVAHAKAMCDELELAVKELEGDKLDDAKYEVAKDAKDSLEAALKPFRPIIFDFGA